MKLSDSLLKRIVEGIHARREDQKGFAQRIGVDPATVSRIFNRQVEKISDATAEKISAGLNIPLPEMLVLSAGLEVKEQPAEYGTRRDVFDDLVHFLRNEATEEGKKAVLMTARGAGFVPYRPQGFKNNAIPKIPND